MSTQWQLYIQRHGTTMNNGILLALPTGESKKDSNRSSKFKTGAPFLRISRPQTCVACATNDKVVSWFAEKDSELHVALPCRHNIRSVCSPDFQKTEVNNSGKISECKIGMHLNEKFTFSDVMKCETNGKNDGKQTYDSKSSVETGQMNSYFRYKQRNQNRIGQHHCLNQITSSEKRTLRPFTGMNDGFEAYQCEPNQTSNSNVHGLYGLLTIQKINLADGKHFLASSKETLLKKMEVDKKKKNSHSKSSTLSEQGPRSSVTSCGKVLKVHISLLNTKAETEDKIYTADAITKIGDANEMDSASEGCESSSCSSSKTINRTHFCSSDDLSNLYLLDISSPAKNEGACHSVCSERVRTANSTVKEQRDSSEKKDKITTVVGQDDDETFSGDHFSPVSTMSYQFSGRDKNQSGTRVTRRAGHTYSVETTPGTNCVMTKDRQMGDLNSNSKLKFNLGNSINSKNGVNLSSNIGMSNAPVSGAGSRQDLLMPSESGEETTLHSLVTLQSRDDRNCTENLGLSCQESTLEKESPTHVYSRDETADGKPSHDIKSLKPRYETNSGILTKEHKNTSMLKYSNQRFYDVRAKDAHLICTSGTKNSAMAMCAKASIITERKEESDANFGSWVGDFGGDCDRHPGTSDTTFSNIIKHQTEIKMGATEHLVSKTNVYKLKEDVQLDLRETRNTHLCSNTVCHMPNNSSRKDNLDVNEDRMSQADTDSDCLNINFDNFKYTDIISEFNSNDTTNTETNSLFESGDMVSLVETRKGSAAIEHKDQVRTVDAESSHSNRMRDVKACSRKTAVKEARTMQTKAELLADIVNSKSKGNTDKYEYTRLSHDILTSRGKAVIKKPIIHERPSELVEDLAMIVEDQDLTLSLMPPISQNICFQQKKIVENMVENADSIHNFRSSKISNAEELEYSRLRRIIGYVSEFQPSNFILLSDSEETGPKAFTKRSCSAIDTHLCEVRSTGKAESPDQVFNTSPTDVNNLIPVNSTSMNMVSKTLTRISEHATYESEDTNASIQVNKTFTSPTDVNKLTSDNSTSMNVVSKTPIRISELSTCKSEDMDSSIQASKTRSSEWLSRRLRKKIAHLSRHRKPFLLCYNYNVNRRRRKTNLKRGSKGKMRDRKTKFTSEAMAPATTIKIYSEELNSHIQRPIAKADANPLDLNHRQHKLDAGHRPVTNKNYDVRVANQTTLNNSIKKSGKNQKVKNKIIAKTDIGPNNGKPSEGKRHQMAVQLRFQKWSTDRKNWKKLDKQMREIEMKNGSKENGIKLLAEAGKTKSTKLSTQWNTKLKSKRSHYQGDFLVLSKTRLACKSDKRSDGTSSSEIRAGLQNPRHSERRNDTCSKYARNGFSKETPVAEEKAKAGMQITRKSSLSSVVLKSGGGYPPKQVKNQKYKPKGTATPMQYSATSTQPKHSKLETSSPTGLPNKVSRKIDGPRESFPTVKSETHAANVYMQSNTDSPCCDFMISIVGDSLSGTQSKKSLDEVRGFGRKEIQCLLKMMTDPQCHPSGIEALNKARHYEKKGIDWKSISDQEKLIKCIKWVIGKQDEVLQKIDEEIQVLDSEVATEPNLSWPLARNLVDVERSMKGEHDYLSDIDWAFPEQGMAFNSQEAPIHKDLDWPIPKVKPLPGFLKNASSNQNLNKLSNKPFASPSPPSSKQPTRPSRSRRQSLINQNLQSLNRNANKLSTSVPYPRQEIFEDRAVVLAYLLSGTELPVPLFPESNEKPGTTLQILKLQEKMQQSGSRCAVSRQNGSANSGKAERIPLDRPQFRNQQADVKCGKAESECTEREANPGERTAINPSSINPGEKTVINSSSINPEEKPVINSSSINPGEKPVINSSSINPGEKTVINSSNINPGEKTVINSSSINPGEKTVINSSSINPGEKIVINSSSINSEEKTVINSSNINPGEKNVINSSSVSNKTLVSHKVTDIKYLSVPNKTLLSEDDSDVKVLDDRTRHSTSSQDNAPVQHHINQGMVNHLVKEITSQVPKSYELTRIETRGQSLPDSHQHDYVSMLDELKNDKERTSQLHTSTQAKKTLCAKFTENDQRQPSVHGNYTYGRSQSRNSCLSNRSAGYNYHKVYPNFWEWHLR